MIKKSLQKLYLALIFIILYAPIVTLMVLSFNQSKTRSKWGGFTLKWYKELFQNEQIMSAFYTTLIIAFLSAAAATVIGTAAAIAIQGMKNRWRTLYMGVTNIPMMNAEIGFGRKVLQVLEEQGISFEHIPSGIDTMTIYIHQDEFAEKEQQVISGIHRAVNPDYMELETDLALIAIVGRGMRSNRGTAARIFAALAHANINVRMIDQGSSELNVIVGVKDEDFEPAIRAIYDIFVLAQV